MCIAPDGALTAYFGYPDGLPDASRRALAAVRRWAEHAPAATLLWRAALHHGPMLPGDPAAPDALGSLSAVARRLAESARFGQWVASQAFADRLPQQPWRRLSRGLDAYPFDDPGSLVPPDAPARTAAGDQPLVGRAEQKAQLVRHWRGARRGQAKAVVVAGPPGSGKSRLVRWAAQRVGEGARVRWLACQEAHHDAPYGPLAECLRQEVGLHAQAPAEAREAAFDDWWQRRAPALGDEPRLMLRWLLGLPAEVDSLWPTARRRRLHDALVAWLRHDPASGPVLLVAEDVHWADPSTLAVLEECAAAPGAAHWMLLATARPPAGLQWQPGWPRVQASPLTPAQGRELLARVLQAGAGGQAPAALDEAAVGRVLERSQGNPLFIESLGLAEARRQSAQAGLGESLLGAVAGDDAALQLAQNAAVLGDGVGLDALHALSPELPEDGFHAALRRLERAGLAHRQGGALHFHHALIRDAAYDSLQASEQRRLHALALARAAQAPPERQAWHAARAGLAEQAADAYERAAQAALALAAYDEAVARFAAALEWVERLPASPANERRALRLMLGEAQATMPLCGYGAERTRAAYRRVLERGSAQPHDDEVFRAHYGLWLGGSSHGGYRDALGYAERLQRFAQATGRHEHWMQAHYAFGNTHVWLGELAPARERLQACLGLHARHRPDDLLAHYSEDTGVIALSLLGWVAWLEGRDAEAQALQERGLALARGLNHAYSVAFALACAGRLDVIRGDAPQLTRRCDELQALADRHAFAIWQATAAMFRGWLLCHAGSDAGVPLLDAGVAAVSQALPALEVTFLSMQADALWRLGRPDDCAAVLDTALARCEHWSDRYMQPELLRLLAECRPRSPLVPGWRAAARQQAAEQGAQAWIGRLEHPSTLIQR